jgi:hypothetical protein
MNTISMIFGLIGYLVAGALAWNNIRWRVRNLENNHADMKTLLEKQIEITRIVELNSVELKVISKASERRLQIVEDRIR